VTVVSATLVRGDHPLLEFDCASHGVHRTGELDQNAVTHHLHDTAMMLADEWLQDSPAPLL
jgi:hypothetical protein